MLTPLQQRVARIVNQLPDAAPFALAGGGALVGRGEVERTTRDLDFFATRPEQVLQLLPSVERALRDSGLEVTIRRADPGFARLTVADHSSTTELDLASDYRLLPTEDTPVGRTLAGEELAVDKVLALFDRAEARDFVDLAAVVDRWGLDHLCRRATEKDRGFDRTILAEQLARVDRLPTQEFQLPSDALDTLKRTVRQWQAEL